MNINTIIFVLFTITVSPLLGMQDIIEYKQASLDDLKGLVTIINEDAVKDSDKIVVLPENFREGSTKNAIEKGRIFIATNYNKIIGFKKLFVAQNDECNDILTHELRITSGQEVQACAKIVFNSDVHTENTEPSVIKNILKDPITYIYTGGDFTHALYRGKGINNNLTTSAFNSIESCVVDDIKKKQSLYLAIMYGLTTDNAGSLHDIMGGRTKNIAKQFIPFAQTVTKACNMSIPREFFIGRYNALKPSFDLKDKECKPLPDEKSIPGYGYVILCPLSKELK